MADIQAFADNMVQLPSSTTPASAPAPAPPHLTVEAGAEPVPVSLEEIIRGYISDGPDYNPVSDPEQPFGLRPWHLRATEFDSDSESDYDSEADDEDQPGWNIRTPEEDAILEAHIERLMGASYAPPMYRNRVPLPHNNPFSRAYIPPATTPAATLPATRATPATFSHNYSCFSSNVSALDEGAATATAAATEIDSDATDVLCKVCYTNILQSVCSPCGHVYMCLNCVQQQVDCAMPARCGICKVGISDIYQVKI
jgi:Zinc finger, C3HC4 type (RING finger)